MSLYVTFSRRCARLWAGGTISGSTIKFKSTQMGRGGEINITWSGTLKGDEIAMTRTIEGGQGQPQEFTLKRQK